MNDIEITHEQEKDGKKKKYNAKLPEDGTAKTVKAEGDDTSEIEMRLQKDGNGYFRKYYEVKEGNEWKKHQTPRRTLWYVTFIGGPLLLVGGGIAIWYFFFRKRPSREEQEAL